MGDPGRVSLGCGGRPATGDVQTSGIRRLNIMPYLYIPPPQQVQVRGLGAACQSYLSPVQIFQVAKDAGFPWSTAIEMTAIALRESGGCTTAHNPGPGEDSYGLWQINVQGNPGILSALGLSDPSQLYDPATNAAAAFLMWGGNDANLNTAWYINKPGYSEAYQAQLPIAQQAAASLGFDTSTSTPSPDVALVDPNAFSVDLSSFGGPVLDGQTVMLGLGLVLLAVVASRG